VNFEWRPSKQKINGFACIEHKVNGELALSGLYGEIWQYSATELRAVIYSHRISKKYLPKNKWPINPQDETLIRFSPDDLILWVDRLRVPAKANTQADIANGRTFGAVAKSNIGELIADIPSSKGKTATEIKEEDLTPTIPRLRTNLPSETECPNALAKKREGS
jgi:hypothetical protein